MPRRMRAAVGYAAAAPLEVEEVTLDDPIEGEVVVRIEAAAICHSDLHALRGDWRAFEPTVAGHEAAGVVEEVGPGVAGFRPGDRVVVSLLRACGRCGACAAGLTHMCRDEWPLGPERRIVNGQGEPLRQAFRTAAFAEYVVVDQSQLVAVPGDVPMAEASLLACGVITGAGAVLNTARVPPDASVAVIGIGGVGVNALQAAAIAGANPIIALDVLRAKLETARQFGATHAVRATDPDAAEQVKALTAESLGVDYVFVTVGAPGVVEQALSIAAPCGTVVVVGLPPSATTATIPVFDFGVAEQRLIGCVMGGTHLQRDVPRLIEHYRAGRLKLSELITARYPLDSINDALVSTASGQALRNVVDLV